MQRVCVFSMVLLAGGLAVANDGSPDVAETSYLNAEFQGEYAAPGMRHVSFPTSTFETTNGTVGSTGLGFGGPYCETGYWHDLYPTHCHNYHHMWLWDDYCTGGWHGWGGHGCATCDSHCGGDCAAAAPDHEHVEIAPAVVDPAESEESSGEDSSEPSSDELAPPREEPEVHVPPTRKLDETVDNDDAYEAEDFRDSTEAPITSDEQLDSRKIEFVPVEDGAEPTFEKFDGLED